MSFLGLEIARRSLHGHQRALTTTSHNISNISTPGYSRQEAVLQSALAISYPAVGSPRPGQLGTGMMVSEIKRYGDAYLDRQVREAKSAIGYNAAIENTLQRVEAVLPEPTDFGIQALLGNFFNSWHTLAQDVDNAGAQAAVRGAAQSLASSLTLAHHSLTGIAGDMESLFDQHVEKINSLGAQLAELNWEIAYQKNAGANPNDLLDRRDLLLEDLAKLADVKVEVVNSDLETVSVSVYGIQLVNGMQYDNRESKFGFQDFTKKYEYNSEEPPALEITNRTREELLAIVEHKRHGELAGVAWSETQVSGYLGQLENLMVSLADEVNRTLGGEPDFFELTVNIGENGDEPSGKVIGIAVGDDAAKAIEGITAEKAWAIAQIREKPIVQGGATVNVTVVENAGQPQVTVSIEGGGDDLYTFDNFYHHLVTGIGADINTAQRGMENVNAILGQIEGLRESVSGVNLDEELTKMMQYMYGYQAAARVVTMMDELLDTLINRMAI